MILLDKEYYGFEDVYDYFRDAQEIFEFPEDKNFKNIKGEFGGKLKVIITFEPAENDIIEGLSK